METRKLRLWLAAFLRGNTNLVAADYPQGLRSILRENSLLLALDLLLSAEHARMVSQTAFTMQAPHLDHKRMDKNIENMQKSMQYWLELMSFNIRVRPPFARGSVDALAKLYKAMQKSAFFDMIREQHFRINPEARSG